MEYQSVGKTVERVDGKEKVTGAAFFTNDMSFPGLLQIKILRSPYAHAKIKYLNTEKALAMPGITAVVTGKDIPGKIGFAIRDESPIAADKVRFAGEPVAAVVARSERDAMRALKEIEVEYEPLDFVITPKEAAAQSAPVIHEELLQYPAAPYVRREGGNIYQHFKVRKGGDVDNSFDKCAVVVEGQYKYPYLQHAAMEPHCAVCCYKPDHSIEMHASTQAPFVVQECLAELHGIPRHKVRVSAPYLGGGFGGKSDITIEALVSCVARMVPGRFVKLALSREEVFCGSTLGRGSDCTYKLGFSQEGKLIAMQGENYLGSGAVADYAINIVTGMAHAGTGPYEVENVKLDVYGVYTNTPPIGAARAYGHPEVHLPVECLMDKAASILGISPYEIRMKNLLCAGKTNGIGQTMKQHNGDILQCTEKVQEELNSKEITKAGRHIKVGRGIACYMKTPCMPSNVQSGAMMKLNGDGTITLSTGAIEMGQGTYTALAQIAAEALDIPVDKINVNRVVDTFVSPYEWQTVASHTTWGVGNAILIAAEDLKENLRNQAASYFKTAPEEIIFEKGQACYKNEKISWAKLALGTQNPDGTALSKPVEGMGYFVPDYVQSPDPDSGQRNAAADWTFGCVGAEVGVDTSTGEIHIYRIINAIDAGTIINPGIAADQVSGAMVLVIGSTLSETLVFSEDRGHIRNNDLVDYKIPGIEDLPEEMKVIFVQTPEESGPYGAKGLGEHGSVAVAPALLNAIHDAIGKDFYTRPVTADSIIEALKGGDTNAAN